MFIFTDGKRSRELLSNFSKIPIVEMNLNLNFYFSQFYFMCMGIFFSKYVFVPGACLVPIGEEEGIEYLNWSYREL